MRPYGGIMEKMGEWVILIIFSWGGGGGGEGCAHVYSTFLRSVIVNRMYSN